MKPFISAVVFSLLCSASPAQNVGIGISSPQAPLHISSAANEALRIDAPQPQLTFYNNGVQTGAIQTNSASMNISSVDGFFARPVFISPNGNFSTSFLNNGNVGIGTPAPAARLQVEGGNYDIENTFGDVLIGNGDYSLRIGINNAVGGGIPGRVFINASASGLPGRLYLGHNGNTSLLGLYDGKVGIGLGFGPPDAKLHIASTSATNSTPTLLLDDLNPIQVFRGFQATGRIGTTGNSFFMETAGGSSGILFRPGGIPTMTLQGAFVGIGTVLPATVFDVYTNADVWHAYIGGATGRLQFAGQTGNGAVIQSINPATTAVRDLYLQRDGGNVGIGTTNPTVKLQVSGAQQLDFVSGATPHLLLNQTDAGYARLGFGNSNGRCFTIAALRTGAAATDQLNFYSDQAGLDRFVFYGNGNATFGGTLTQNSDIRLKKNIQPVRNVLSALNQIGAYTYQWKEEQRGSEEQIGLLAQEVELEFPQLVRTDAQGYKSVAYQNMVPLLLQAIKEQQEEIELLKKALKK